MSKSWFTEKGAQGELELERRDGGWFVSSPGSVGDTKCLISNPVHLEGASSTHVVEIEVTRFCIGSGDETNFLFVSDLKGDNGHRKRDSKTNNKSTEKTADKQPDNGNTDTSASDPNPPRKQDFFSANEDWQLKDFNGSGEYVNIEATIDSIFYIKKNTRGMPDMKGDLTDESVLNPVKFVIDEGVRHPHLNEGDRYRFKNVKDHLYVGGNEIQVVINKNTDFIELDSD
ncbi:hypothetical protein ACLI4Q_10970 [Natrialbaceae archaeon A-CW1-1]